jgi:hypothetical protein
MPVNYGVHPMPIAASKAVGMELQCLRNRDDDRKSRDE